jgi:DNA/RNA endonuclease YhcR with UshA esterase domain/histidinol phosphatase-like PHP family hydrolase
MKEMRFAKYLAFILVFVLIVPVGFLANTVTGLTPLTVEEAIENQGLNDQTVRGYIIGTVKNGPVLVTSGHVDTNLMLASSKDETDVKKMLPVQLPKTAVRTAWNLKDNPENLGKLVDVTGDLTAYFSAPGLKNTSNIAEVENSDTESSILTIAEARQVTGTTVFETSGIVTFIDSRNLTIQDATAGIVARISAEDPAIKLGDQIWVKGTPGAFNGLQQINVSDYAVKSSDNALPEAQKVSLSDLLADMADSKAYESERVLLENLTVKEGKYANSPSFTDGTNEIASYKIPVDTLKNGDKVNLIAISSYYNAPQLRVAKAEDIRLLTGDDPPASGITIAEGRNETGSYTTSGIVTLVDGRSITIQDETAGIVLRLRQYDGSITLGDRIEATGSNSEYNKLLQLNETSYRVLSSGNPLPEAQEITLDTYLADAESYESERIKISNATLVTLNTNGNSLITADGTQINIYKIPEGNYQAGNVVNVTAVASQYKDTYQLRVADASHVEIVDDQHLDDKVFTTDLPDPITEEDILDLQTFEGIDKIYNVKEAAALSKENAQSIYVIGVVTYAYSGGNSLIIQDIIDKQIFGYQIYGPTEEVQPGDIVLAKGNAVLFYGLPELSNVDFMKIVGNANVFEPQEITVEDVLAYGDQFVNEYVMFKDLELPVYDGGSGQLYFKNKNGVQLQTYRAPAYPIGSKAGDIVDIKGAISPHNGTPQIRLNDYKDYIITNDTLKPFIILPKFPEAKKGMDYVISFEVLDNVGINQVEAGVRYIKADGSLERFAAILKPINNSNMYELRIPAAHMVADEVEFFASATDLAGNQATDLYFAPFEYGKTESFGTSYLLKLIDVPSVLNPSPSANDETGDDKRPTITVDLVNAGENPTVTLKIQDRTVEMTVVGNKASYTPPADLPNGRLELEVNVTRADGKKSEPFKWSFFIGESTLRHYRGQIHSHSNFSDGAGSVHDAYTYASNAEYIDFFALTDHSNYFDTEDNLGDIYDGKSGLDSPLDANLKKWEHYRKIADSYNNPGNFATLFGYEMTWTKSGANYGHINTYNTDGFVSRNHPVYNDKSESRGLLAYYELMAEVSSKNPLTFSQFNHPGSTFGTFDDFAHYTPEYNKNLKLIEVGNGEGKVGSNGYWRSYEHYTNALDKGWKLAPSNNQDNHKGKWGDANDTRTVVISDALTREAIIRGILDLRVYATEDKNQTIDFYVDGNIMGSTIDADQDIHVKVDVADPDQHDVIQKVEIIGQGGQVLYAKEANTNIVSFETDLANTSPYYYVRVTQVDGELAVTAPVWTGFIEKVDIDSVSKNTELEFVGEATSITTKFVNTTKTAATIEKVEYQLKDGTVLHTVTNNLPDIPAGSSDVTITHDIVPTAVGRQTVVVKVTTDKGVLSAEIELTVYDKAQAVSTIEEVQAAPEGKSFVVEAILTSNASGYDKNTAFFDSAYVQDATGGINIFPISGNYQAGQKVRLYGITGAYQGERQLNVDRIELIDATVNPLAPTKIKTAEVAKNLGLLVKVEGTVEEVQEEKGVISAIIIDDGSGAIRVFIDGYIGRSKSEDKTMPVFKVGDKVTAIGLSSIDPEGNRVRVRNRAEVALVEDEVLTVVPNPAQLNADHVAEYNGTNDLIFSCNGAYSDFLKLLIDGIVVASKYYTVEEGSTIVTVSKEYLDTLAPGLHTLTMVYTKDRSISIPFITTNMPTGSSPTTSTDDDITTKDVPTTGESPTIVFVGFAAIALTGVLVLIRRKLCAKKA